MRAFQCHPVTFRMALLAGVVAALAILVAAGGCKRKYTPPEKVVLEHQERMPAPAYDVWGRSVSVQEAAERFPRRRSTTRCRWSWHAGLRRSPKPIRVRPRPRW